MAGPLLVPIDRPAIAPRTISPRLRSQLLYFACAPATPGVPPLNEGEFFFAAEDVARTLDEGAIHLISPLDTANQTEIELSEEQEALLQWLHDHAIQHVKVQE